MNQSLQKIQDSYCKLIEYLSTQNDYHKAYEYFSCSEQKQYKYFHQLIHKILLMGKNYGIHYEHILISIRESLILDLRFTQKIKDISYGASFQFLMITALTWVFISQMPQGISAGYCFFILCLQIVGWGAYLVLLVCLIRRRIHFSQKLLCALTHLKCLSSVGLSQREIIEQSGIQSIFPQFGVKWDYLKQRLNRLLIGFQEHGQGMEEDLHQMIQEVHFQQNLIFRSLLKQSEGMKLGIICFFYLPTYFLPIYLLASQLLN